jgi:hypothetical protein
MRAGWLLSVALLAVGACNAQAAGADRPSKPEPSPTRLLAAAAGGACQLLDFDAIASIVGTRFDVAAASQTGNTYTCVVEQTGNTLPDLALSVASTQADVGIFKSKVVPNGAATIDQLGKSGYSATVPAGSGAGPGIEVGWLSGNQRLMTVRLRTRSGTAPADAAALVPKVVALAKQIDMTTV